MIEITPDKLEKIIAKGYERGFEDCMSMMSNTLVSRTQAVRIFGWSNVARWEEKLNPIHSGSAKNSRILFKMSDLLKQKNIETQIDILYGIE